VLPADFPRCQVGRADWSFELEMEAYVQDTHENNNDPVHFQYVRMMATPPSEIHTARTAPTIRSRARAGR
jgi:hypothetical protein